MNWRTEEAVYKQFMAGKSVFFLYGFLTEDLKFEGFDDGIERIQQAIRNAIRRAERRKKGGKR